MEVGKSLFELAGNPCRQRAPNLWTVEGFIYSARIPVRMTIIAIDSSEGNDGNPWLILVSPFPPTPEVRRIINELGQPKFLVVPNLMHTMFVKAAVNAYPKCIIVGPKQLATKKPDLPCQVLVNGECGLPTDWPPEVLIKFVPGLDVLSELVVLHNPSGTLILTDLAFNFDKLGETPLPKWPMTWYLYLAKGYRRCCTTTPFAFLMNDATAVKAALDAILKDWTFGRVIVAHGSVLESNGQEALLEGTYSFVSKIVAARERRDPKKLLWWSVSVAVGLGAVVAGVLYVANTRKTG